jgi:hypothetical protein
MILRHGYDGLVLTKGPIKKWMDKKLADDSAGKEN